MNMKIDAHQHFWKYAPETHAWISDELRILKRDFLPQHLLPELQAKGYDGCVAVQASQTPDENSFLLELANSHDFIRGVVGWVDLCSEAAAEQLRHYAQHPRFKGVRHIVQDEPDDHFLLRPDFLRGIAALQPLGLTYDLLIYTKHMATAKEFLQRCPTDLPIVLDHLAKPNIAKQDLAQWRKDLAELAAFPNLSCKLSGMVTEAAWGQWQAADFKPVLEAALESFGPQRLMIGSDWPVCLLSANYSATVAIVEDFISTLGANEQAAILGLNAVNFYRL